jgi:hypothetical protein
VTLKIDGQIFDQVKKTTMLVLDGFDQSIQQSGAIGIPSIQSGSNSEENEVESEATWSVNFPSTQVGDPFSK